MHTARYETALNGYRPAPVFPPPRPPVPLPPLVPRPARRTGLVTVVVLASLFLVSAAVFVTLFLIAGNDHREAVTRLDERRSELTDVNDRVRSAESERQRADQRNNGLKSDNAELSGCVTAMRHYLWDGLAAAQRTAAARDVLAQCR